MLMDVNKLLWNIKDWFMSLCCSITVREDYNFNNDNEKY